MVNEIITRSISLSSSLYLLVIKTCSFFNLFSAGQDARISGICSSGKREGIVIPGKGCRRACGRWKVSRHFSEFTCNFWMLPIVMCIGVSGDNKNWSMQERDFHPVVLLPCSEATLRMLRNSFVQEWILLNDRSFAMTIYMSSPTSPHPVVVGEYHDCLLALETCTWFCLLVVLCNCGAISEDANRW